MAAAIGISDERSALTYRHYEQLYRLALLVVGEPEATDRLIERVFAAPNTGDIDAALVRELRAIGKRAAPRRPWSFAADALDFIRAGIDPAQGQALLQVLAALTPRDRLIVGLYYLRGLAPHDIDTLLELAPSAADVLAQVRIALGRALELLPTLIGTEMLLRLDRYATDALDPADVAALRVRLHTYPELRDARAGLLQAHQLLMRALLALLAVAPPPELLERLLDGPTTRPRQPRLPRPNWAHIGLIGLVVVIIAALLAAPALVRPGATPDASSPPTAAKLVDSAIHRLEQQPLQAGVLHEVYRVAWSDQPAYTIERWYEYAAPHRLRVELRTQGGSMLLLAIASDGHGLVQFRTTNKSYFGNQLNDSLDVRISAEELATALPILRELPSPGVYPSGPLDTADISRFFLASARANQATIMGATTFRQRSGYIVAYRTTQPLPPPLAIYFRRLPPPTPHRVLLTIDSQTYALLDVAVLPEGDSAAPTQHPWQMQSFSVVAQVEDAVFRLPDIPGIAQRTELSIPRGTGGASGRAQAPRAIAEQLRRPLLVPQALPDPTMRGVILAGEHDPADPSDLRLIYDGAFVSMALLPAPITTDPAPTGPDERTAGAFKYQLLSNGVRNSDLVVAAVYPIASPHEQMLLMLMDAYATPEEREATVRKVIASLVPLTSKNADSLERYFYRPASGE